MGGCCCCCFDAWDETNYSKLTVTTPLNYYDDEENAEEICQELLKLDERINTPGGYMIKPGGRKLFTYVNPLVLSKPLFRALQDVQSIYHSQRGFQETYTAGDKQKQFHFLDQVLQTRIMKRCLAILNKRQLFNGDSNDFRERLYYIWFHLWGTQHDTCAFEHVFVGERVVHNGRVGIVEGFHNWVQYYRQQQKGGITNYVPLALPQNNQIAREDALIVKMSFDWLGQHKRVDSMFIGTTPAFEMAVYTYLFFSVDEDNSKTAIQLEGHDIKIALVKNGDRIITTYPEACRI